MTAILAYANGRAVWMGGDSLGMAGWTRIISGERKVWRAGDLLIGGSGVLSVVQKLKRTTAIPVQTDDGDALDYLINVVAPIFRDALKTAEMSMFNDECDTALLIGYRGQIYDVTPSFGITPIVPRYRDDGGTVRAMGSGGDVALGAFEAFREFRREIGDNWQANAMYNALRIAADHNVTVAGPYYVECVSVAEAERT